MFASPVQHSLAVAFICMGFCLARRVLLTGCCGFIGAWITQELIRSGWSVRGTSREPEYAESLHAEAFDRREATQGERERLEIVPAELLDATSWNSLADGCEIVIHTACPVNTEPGTPREAMHDPAVVGTRNVVSAAAQAGTVRRFIHLSSVVTLLDHHRPVAHPERGEQLGPASWNETASPEIDPYAHAKVIAERSARAMVRDAMPRATFASVLPGPVIGPPVAGKRVPESIHKTMAPFLTGQLKAGSVDLCLQVVDVRDVAAACVAVANLDDAALQELGERSRFIVVAQPVARIQELADMLADDFIEYRSVLPRRPLPLPRWMLLAAMKLAVTREAYSYTRAMLGRPLAYDTSLVEKTLQITWRPQRESLRDTVQWLRERGHYPPPAGRGR